MNSYIAIIFGILGICLGLRLPAIADQIIVYKNTKRNRRILVHGLDKRICGLIVILNGLLWVYAGMKVENTFIALLVSLLFTGALLISVIDLRIHLIPNELVLLMLCLGVLFQILNFGWRSLTYALICMVAVGLLFALAGKLVGFDQVGAGDVKLAAAIGLILGYPYIKFALIGMSVGLLVFCLGGLAMKKLTTRSTFAFAPFIMFGTIGALVYMMDF